MIEHVQGRLLAKGVSNLCLPVTINVTECRAVERTVKTLREGERPAWRQQSRALPDEGVPGVPRDKLPRSIAVQILDPYSIEPDVALSRPIDASSYRARF